MNYQIGDTVIHWAHGLGEIVLIEEKIIGNQSTNCYVVHTPEMMIWIPIDDQQHSLRCPTPPGEFEKLLSVLTSPGEKLLEDRVQRMNQLMALLKDGQLVSVFRVVRDLSWYKKERKLNDQEKSILGRAIKALLNEWVYSLGVPLSQAQLDMTTMLAT